MRNRKKICALIVSVTMVFAMMTSLTFANEDTLSEEGSDPDTISYFDENGGSFVDEDDTEDQSIPQVLVTGTEDSANSNENDDCGDDESAPDNDAAQGDDSAEGDPSPEEDVPAAPPETQPIDISEEAWIEDIPAVTYNGSQQCPEPTIYVGESGAKLEPDTDYTVSYGKNINAGIGTVTITGLGRCYGTLTKEFTIGPQSITPVITLSKTKYTWNNKIHKPSVNVKYGDVKLQYKITWEKGRKNVGTYKGTVKLTGNYSGKKVVSFTIVPKGTSISRLTSGTKAFTATWAKQKSKMSSSHITGYQLQYCNSKTFKRGVKSVKIKGYDKNSRKISKLKAETTYYVRIRTYKTHGKKTFYSAWSKAKSVKTAPKPPYRPRILVLDDDKSNQEIVKMLRNNGCRAEMLWTRYIDVSRYDGLVIPGGHNIDPRMYGAKRSPYTYGDNIEKDKIQIEMIQKFAKANKPVLGVCRGCQVINVAFGGPINQHISGWHKWNRTITVSKSSWLYNSYGSNPSVYHFHHQCVEKLGDGLIATQWDAQDHHIEAIEHKTLPVYGVQWHPDSMGNKGYPVFKGFRNICVKQKKKNDAVRTPNKTSIMSAEADGNTVKIEWKATKNTEKYSVYIQTGNDGWKYWKSVYKNGENRECFSDTLKYKLVASGNYYRIYVRKNPYKKVGTTKSTHYKFSGKSGRKYTFVIQSFNGIVHSSYSAPKTVRAD